MASSFRRSLPRVLAALAMLGLGRLMATPSAAATLPDPSLQKYVAVTVTTSTQQTFNYVPCYPKTVSISGKYVLFDATTKAPTSTLYASFNGKTDIKNMYIYAETVVIRSALSLPGTTVTLYAEHLRFEDNAATGQFGSITTTPLALTAIPGVAGQQTGGADGLPGGKFYLYISDVFPADPGFVRLNSTGGAAQPGGLGLNGTAGSTMKVATAKNPGLPSTTALPAGTVYIFEYPTSGGTTVYFGSDAWPGDGAAATAPGRPGSGGPGGNLIAPMFMQNFGILAGGLSGAKAPDAVGGAAGTPVNAAHTQYFTIYSGLNHYALAESHTSLAGAGAPAPDPLYPAGGDGGFYPDYYYLTDWFHPFMVQGLLLYYRDAFAAGCVDETRSAMTTYLADLTPYMSTSNPAYMAMSLYQKQALFTWQAEMQELLAQTNLPPQPKNSVGRPWGEYR